MSMLTELYARVDAAKAELDGLRPLDQERENRVMQKFRLWWTYHSNAIEGNQLTQGETEMFLMEGLTAKGKPLKDHLDLRGHNEAINFLLGFVREKHELTEVDIRNLHKILLVEPYEVDAITPDGTPTKKVVAIGEYKTSANHVRTRTGEIHYYATPEETPAKMHDLMTWYREEKVKGEMHPVELAARFHHRFTAIHPFDDGNGRMSRLLMNLMLMQMGYPPVVLRLTERNQYLAALRRADSDEYDDFIAMIGERTLDSLTLYIRAAKGEEVSEPTDIKKEIELEILRLQHVEEPLQRTPELIRALFERSIKPLVTELLAPLISLNELFFSNGVNLSSDYLEGTLGRGSQQTTTLQSINLTAHIEQCLRPNCVPTATNIKFALNGFRKARFDNFNLSADLQAHFEPLKYRVTLLHQHGSIFTSVTHFYQEQVSRDESKVFTDKLAQFLLNEIRMKTKP